MDRENIGETLEKKALENTVGKGENAGNQHFLLFPQCFLLYQREILMLATFNFLSANAFNLVKSKILLFGKGLSIMSGGIYSLFVMEFVTFQDSAP